MITGLYQRAAPNAPFFYTNILHINGRGAIYELWQFLFVPTFSQEAK
jgi:hypothetical protein